MPQTLNIVPVGLNEQDRLVVMTATKLLSFDQIQYQIFDGQIAKAHILIIDDAHSEGKQALKQCRPGQIKFIITDTPEVAKNTIGLQRPIELAKIKNLLTKIYTKLQQQLRQQQRVQPLIKEVQEVPILSDSLFKLLLDTKEKKQILRISSSDLPDFFIDGRNHCLATVAKDAEIDRLLAQPLTALSITHMNTETFSVHSNDLSIQSLNNLLWLAGIKCSDGKLLSGHRVDKPFRLRAWPNFTRNTFIAEHLKLAAVLAKQAMNLVQLSELTQIALSDVINFYNAAYAVDLIEHKTTADIAPVVSRKSSSAKQGLLSKIAKRLNLTNIF